MYLNVFKNKQIFLVKSICFSFILPFPTSHNIQDDFHSHKSTSQDYRDAEKIADSYSDEVVIMAAMRVLRLRGRTASYQVVKAIMDDEDLAETLHKVIKDTTKDSRSLTPEEGLSHLHARDWSKEDWIVSIHSFKSGV